MDIHIVPHLWVNPSGGPPCGLRVDNAKVHTYRAYFLGHAYVEGFGPTPDAAIGAMVRSRPTCFNVKAIR